MSSAAQLIEIRAWLQQALDNYVAAGFISHRGKIVVEQRFALSVSDHQGFKEIGEALQIGREQARQILFKTMNYLRQQPDFVEQMNIYLQLVPYPKGIKQPYWIKGGQILLLQPSYTQNTETSTQSIEREGSLPQNPEDQGRRHLKLISNDAL